MKYKTFHSQDGKELTILSQSNYPCRSKRTGGTGVCVSAVAAYFGIDVKQHKYLWSYKRGIDHLSGLIRKQGYSVTDMSYKWMKIKTLNRLQKNLENWEHLPPDAKIIVFVTRHILVMDINGNRVCDTVRREINYQWIHAMLLVTPKD